MATLKSRGWVYVIHENADNKIDTDEIFDTLKGKENGVLYHVCGKEVCPKTMNRHLQGYAHFKNAKSRTQFQKWTAGGLHFCEPVKGTDLQNKKYCSKDGAFFEIGKPTQQGKRNDITRTNEILEDGANMREVISTATSIQTIQYAAKWLTYHERKRDFPCEVQWFYGPPGTGKSYRAAKENPNAYWCTKDSKWWDGYDGHDTVIIDDMRGDWCKFHEFLRLADRHPYRVEVKGGYRQLLASKIVVTTCKAPEEMWSVVMYNENLQQLTRRLNSTIYFGKDGKDECISQTQK